MAGRFPGAADGRPTGALCEGRDCISRFSDEELRQVWLTDAEPRRPGARARRRDDRGLRQVRRGILRLPRPGWPRCSIPSTACSWNGPGRPWRSAAVGPGPLRRLDRGLCGHGRQHLSPLQPGDEPEAPRERRAVSGLHRQRQGIRSPSSWPTSWTCGGRRSPSRRRARRASWSCSRRASTCSTSSATLRWPAGFRSRCRTGRGTPSRRAGSLLAGTWRRRPFDAQAQGTVPGKGCGVVVLEAA